MTALIDISFLDEDILYLSTRLFRWPVRVYLCRNLQHSFWNSDLNYHSSTHTMIAYFLLTECVAGLFGNNCVENCSMYCGDPGICDKITAHCNGSCLAGWEGEMCQNGKYVCTIKLYLIDVKCVTCNVFFRFFFLFCFFLYLFRLFCFRYVLICLNECQVTL